MISRLAKSCFAARFGLLCILIQSSILHPGLHAQSSTGAVGLRIIVVETSAQADQVLRELKAGADFAAMAREISIDPTSSGGGYMGRVDLSSLRSELREAVKGVNPGQITGVIKLPSSYAILKVLPESETSASGTVNPAAALPSSATGTIRYAPNVGGKAEADLAYRKFPKPENWNRDLNTLCQIRRDSLASVIETLTKSLDPASPQGVSPGRPLDVIEMHYALANTYAYEGKMDEAIDQWQAAYQIALAQLPAAVPELEEVLGIAYLHKAEMDNDVYRHPGDQCIFPPHMSNQSFAKPAASEKAIDYLLKYLQRKPDALDAKWILNLAYMTLGKYPDSVPHQYLIAPSAFESVEDVGRFVDVAPAAGINLYSMSGGLIVDDFEQNGLFDIVTSDYGQCAPMHFFHNNGDGTFADHTEQAGLSNQMGGLNLIQGDYNNDGCMDILVLRGAWEFPQRKSLLRNNCDGTFTDVTVSSGLGEPTQTQTAVWADIDNDGYIDLFVGNESGPGQLFRNKGDGTFEDISHSSGVDRIGYTKAVAAADYDNDGYVDFFVSNLNGDKFLFHNNHNRTFTDVAAQAGVQKPWQSFAAWFFDYDNDGWPDLFVTSYYVSVDESIRSYLGLTANAETLKLYKNLGNGKFRDVTAEVGLDRVFMPMGANFGDIDNDGFLDMYLGTGNPSYASLLPNVLLHNKEGKFFTDVTAASGTGELHKGHGVVFADIDNDGDEDLLEEIGGAVPGDSHAFRLFENPGNGNDWISLHLVGVKTNRAAIGARVKVTVRDEGKPPRSIFRTVTSGGSFGASPLTQHIGLGKSARITELEITWPVSGTSQVFTNVAPDQFLEIKEFSKNYSKLDRHSFRLGGPSRESTPSAASLKGDKGRRLPQ